MKKLKAILSSLLLTCASAFTSVTAFADAIVPSESSASGIAIGMLSLILILLFIGVLLIGAAVALFFIIRYFVKRNKN